MSLLQLETAVSELAPHDLETFAKWFEEYFAYEWDRRIESDIEAGRLDSAGEQADADFEAGRCTP